MNNFTSKRDRATLKNYFSPGSLPTANSFKDLIDSTLNLVDDGFSRSSKNGVEITLVGTQGQRSLISFFNKPQDDPDWSINCNPDNSLHFVSTAPAAGADPQASQGGATSPGGLGQEVVTLTPEGRVGIHNADPDPDCRLDVDGVIKSAGRMGTRGIVRADGEWHDITGVLDGCNAFEVMAGVGLAGQYRGRYALLHAHAMNTFNPVGFWFNFLNWKKSIRCDHAWYLSRKDRLKLRWAKCTKDGDCKEKGVHKYKLQIKSSTSYGEGIGIQFSITQLWFDQTMSGSKMKLQDL